LRADSHAQYEIREYANIMLEITKKWVPHCYEAFVKYRQSGKEFSGAAIEVLKRKLKGENVSLEESGLSSREFVELTKIFDL
jgi:thymidylate synthase (FAD)